MGNDDSDNDIQSDSEKKKKDKIKVNFKETKLFSTFIIKFS